MSDTGMPVSRFSGPSDMIDLRKLERETKKIFFLGFLVAILANAAAGAYFLFRKTEIRVVKPPMIEFIYLKPKIRRVIKVDKKYTGTRVLRRQVIHHQKPFVEINPKIVSSPVFPLNLHEFKPDIEIISSVSPLINRDYIIESMVLKEPEKQISMRDEMISMEDLDNGRYKAMVIQNPNSKQNIRGFIYIPTVWGAQLKPPDNLKRAFLNLVEAVNRYTGITARSDPHLLLDCRTLLEMPFVYITTDKAFELTEIERRNFGEYLRNGGFALLDNGSPGYDYSQAEASLRQMVRDALGSNARFLPIPNSHPLYHCYFDFDDGPPLGSEIMMESTTSTAIQGETARNATMPEPVNYLEGIWIDNRLVAIYSDKGYGNKWRYLSNNEPQLKMGVNIVVFALTQHGGIAQQKMDLFSAVR
ncbi:DUF4159 domain-containing protein [bacterium]|nr:DUF4159 domain-containing protein [bacterium]